ncbi:uncharacterized protein LOC141900389 [Tubulanus polymorphus]|uniref:uncharacterized protein LOC141900389 n=1 Tax=Tubulanus polymorphus TaxID=672921 RepID=UPI003DA2A127
MISFSSGSVIVTMKLYLKTTVNWKNVTEVVDVPTTFMTEVFTENIHRFLPDYTISTDSVSITVQVLPISATLVPYMRCKHPRYLGDLIVQACLNTFYQLKVSSGSCSQLSKLITCMQKPSGCTSSHILHFLSSYVSQTWISKTMNFRPVVSKCYRVNETLQTGICPDQMSLDSLDKSAPHCFSDGRVTDCGDELARTRCLRQELNCSTSSIADALLNATSCNDTCLNLLSNSSRLIEDMKSICPYQYSWLTDGWKNNTPEINCRHRRLLQLCGHLNDRNCFNRSNNQSELLTQTLIDLNDDYSVSEFDDDLSCQTGANKSSSFSEYWLKWDTWNTCQSYLSECKRALNQSQISAACMCLEKKFIPCVVWANDDFYYGWSSDSVSVGFKSLFERFVNDVDVVRITGFSAKCLASGPHKSTTETAITTTKKNTFQKV